MNPIANEVEKQNEKAEEYRANNEKTIERAAARLNDESFAARGVKYRKLAKEAAKEWGTENRTTKAVDLLLLGNKKKAETELDIKNLAEYMTDEELITYSGLLMTDGAAEAEEYLEAIKEDLRARAFEHEQYPERFKEEAEKLYTNPLGLPEGEYQGASLKGAASKVLQPKTLEEIEKEADESYIKALGYNIAGSAGAAASFIPTAAQAIKNAAGGEYEPTNKYSAAFYPAQTAQAAQVGAMENRSPWLKFLKSAGFSITQSAATAAVGGAVGSANAGLAAMGLSAGGQSAYEAAERGLTPAQSVSLGAVLGTLEAATEKIPLDNMLEAFSSKSAGRQLMLNILSSAGENAVQEGVNEIAGNAADEIIAGSRSELIAAAKEYAEELQAKEGLPDGEAAKKGMKKAFFDKYVASPIYSALSGAFTGAVQTGGAGITGAAISDIGKTAAAYSRGQNAIAAIEKLGYRVELTSDVNLDGKVDKGAKTVYFNPESDSLRETAKHEITHLFEEGGKYGELKEYIKEEMPTAWSAAERRVTERLERVNAQRAERGYTRYPTDAETIEAETMAEIGEALKTERLTRRFALGKDMPTLMKFIEFARDAGEKVKSKFGTDTGWARAAEIWEEALYEVENGKLKIENEDVRNKIMENEKGRYVQAERQVITGDNPDNWEREIIDYVNNEVREGKDLEITLDNGEKLKITGRTAWKLGYRNGKSEGKPISDKAYFVKANASGVIDEITSVSQYANSKKANKAHSGGFGDNGFEYRTAYFRDLDGQYYKLTLSVGKNNAGKEVYNIGKIEKASFPVGSYPFWSSKGSGKDANDSITQKSEAVNSNIRKSNENDTKERYKIREVPEEVYEMQEESERVQKPKRSQRKQRTEYDDTSFSSYAAYLSQRIANTEAKNESLKRTNEILKKMAEISGEVHVDALGVAEYAEEIKKQVNTHMPRRDIAARLEEIYTNLAHSGAEDDGSAAYGALFELANDMLDQSDTVDRTMYDRYADLREYLRNTPISISARDRADIADYADFIKRNRGRIKITKDGTSVDKIYEQLAEDYPEFFADTDKIHPSDRLKHIEEVRDNLDPVYDGRRHTDEEAAMLAQDMFANYFTDKNASWEHQTLLEMLRGEMKRKAETEAEEKYKSEAEHYRERADFYKNLNSKVAERIKGVDSLDPVEPEYVDSDVTAEYGEKYTKNIKFAEGDESAVRVKRRKRKDGGDTLVLDFDRPTVAAGGEHKYKLSADTEYESIIDRVKKRKKADEGLFEGKSHGGERSYYMHDIWRNCRSFFGERDYQKIKEYILDPLDDSKKHYQYIQEFYSNVVYDKVVKELGIKKGSRLSELVQKYGEKTMTEEELKSIPEADLQKIRQADRIFRGIYDGLIDTINETRRKIFPNAEKKAKKLEEALREIREERQMLENAYTSGDLSEVSEGKWLDLKKIEIRSESTNELIYRAQKRAAERMAALNEQIETLEGEMAEVKNKTTKKYDKLAERLDALMTKRAEMSEFAEAQSEKLKSTAEKLRAQFNENSAAYKSKLAERIALLHQREAALKETFATDEISYGREIKKRKDYYRHFEEIKSAVPAFTSYMKRQLQEGTSAAAAIKGFINSSGVRKNQNIDNRLAGKSIDTKPKAKWQSFAQRRSENAEATYDAVGGFLDYIPAAAYAAAIDPNISMFRALAEDLAKADPSAANNTDVGSFTGYLQKYANELAGKTNELGDRLITDTLGRNRMRQINGFAGRVKSNMVCYNVSSSLAQILNVPQAIGYMANHPAALTAAVSDTLAAMVGKGKAAERYKYSSFLSERFADDYSRFERGPKRAATGLANFLLGALDEVGTKYIWNAAYRSAAAEGKANPTRYADDVARRMVSGRGIGEMPYYQKSKLIGMFIPFTLEAGNVLDVYSDIIRDSSQKVQGKKGAGKAIAIGGAAAGDALKFLVLFAANHFFNRVLEMIRGTDGGLFDPIEDIKEGVENNYGIAKTAGTIAGNFLGTVPVGGMVAGIYPEYGISIGSYTTPSRSELFGGSDPTRFGSGNLFSSAMKDPVNYIALPTGGGQVRKAATAALAIADGAVKGKSGKVQFEVDKNVKNKVRGMLFGKSGFAEAAEYYNPKEVNFTKVPEGFEYKHTSRTITKNGEEVKLTGEELERFEKVRKARYERLYEKENAPFVLRNPYRTAKTEVSSEKALPKKAQAADRKMKTLLEGLIDQGTLTKERAKKIYSAYRSGEDISVRGVEYYAPVKIKKTKKFSELTQKQREEYVKKLKSDVKSGEVDEAKGRETYERIKNRDWDFDAEVSEYITGDYKNLTEEEQKKIRSKMNTEATEFAKGK